MDKRYLKLANLLVSHSVSLKKDETVEINVSEIPEDMTIALIRAVREAGGIPIVRTDPARVSREIMKGATKAQMKLGAKLGMFKAKEFDASMDRIS